MSAINCATERKEEEKEHEEIFEEAVQVSSLSSNAVAGGDLYAGICVLPHDGNRNGFQKVQLCRRYLGKSLERI